MKHSLAFILLVMSVGLSAATAEFTSSYKKAFTLIAELRFAEANELIDAERRLQQENKVGAYLKGALIIAEIFANENPDSFIRSQEAIDGYMSEIESISKGNPYRDMFLGELFLAQATLNAKFGANLKAAWQFYKAYQLLTENADDFPEFMPNNLPLGVLYAAIGSLPSDYKSLASFFGMKGDVEEGVQLIKKAFWRLSADEELDFYRPYAGFIYSFTNHQLGASQEISPKSLGLKLEKSSFLLYTQALIDLSEGRAEEALIWLDKRPVGKEYYRFNYLNYFQGKVLLGLDVKRAPYYFKEFLQHAKSTYLKSSYRYLAWCYLLQGQISEAEQMRLKVFSEGQLKSGADKQAYQEAQRGFNKELIKARVLFDVSNYTEAIQVLKKISVEDLEQNLDQVDYYYRWGRIYQELNQQEQAITNFKLAVSKKQEELSFELGNSTLQLALIYEYRKDYSKARKYFKMCLDDSGYPFYAGVQQKANTGLARIKGK